MGIPNSVSKFFRTLSFLAVIVIGSLSFAQRPATGAPPLSTVAGGPDAINLGNLNVHYGFPIFSKPGRGLPFSYTLGYDSSVWQAVQANGSSTWMPVQNWGWQGDSAANVGYIETRDDEIMCWDGDSWAWYTRQTITNYVDRSGPSIQSELRLRTSNVAFNPEPPLHPRPTVPALL